MRHVPVLGGLLGVVALSPLVSGPYPAAARAESEPAPALSAAAHDERRTARDSRGQRQRRAAVRVAAYRGLRIPVPDGWQVHDLERDPSRCVRFDRRAIYLGRPGERPDCPARVIGGEDALHVAPLGPAGTSARAGRGPVRADRLAAYTVKPTADHRVRVPLREAGVVISGSYGTDPSRIQRLIRGATVNGPRPLGDDPDDEDEKEFRDDDQGKHSDKDYKGKDKNEYSPKRPEDGTTLLDLIPRPSDGGGGKPKSKKPKSKSKKPKSKSKSTKGKAPKNQPKTGRQKNWAVGKGFDTCTAPSLASMRAWRKAYRISNIYIGGAARGCAQPNLTRDWVKSARSMGYRLIPTYVGLQAPCGRYRARFTAGNAAAQGRSAAVDAIRKAKALGIPAGKPIYFDMEAYPNDASCRRAVLTFLHNWTVKMKAERYVPGVYSSVGSGIRDLARTTGYTLPQAVWFAHWDGKPRLYGHPQIPDRLWHPHRRIKQYRGGHRETHGGVTINIDSNNVDGRVY
ncbi:hypothetical protein GCM10010191_93260 [Actinomadura vinacea]|uniref:Rv2525c-like glycoside hydrolase-like domain-containing protein n=1 Tax=Actinomadura vinacea TaxID=115336 RepID=A0ABP5XKI8_9ACTN